LCKCKTREEEGYFIIEQYARLASEVPFDEFCSAYKSSSLAALFAANGMLIRNRFILHALSFSHISGTVWYLKNFVRCDPLEAPELILPETAAADYGFTKCTSAEDECALREVYKRLLVHPDVDPLALYNACLEGRLFEHASGLTKLKPGSRFKRLMQNMYSLVSEI
jgi:hypothetical protein